MIWLHTTLGKAPNQGAKLQGAKPRHHGQSIGNLHSMPIAREFTSLYRHYGKPWGTDGTCARTRKIYIQYIKLRLRMLSCGFCVSCICKMTHEMNQYSFTAPISLVSTNFCLHACLTGILQTWCGEKKNNNNRYRFCLIGGKTTWNRESQLYQVANYN